MLKSKKFFVLAVCVFILASCGSALAEYSGGTGTEADPYIIASIADFKQIAMKENIAEETKGQYFKLTTEIDLTGETYPANPSYGISHGYISDFGGNFDGQGHTITVNFNRDDNTSLFGSLGDNETAVTIKNLNVTGTIKINGADTDDPLVGSIATFLHSGTIENCHFNGQIEVSGGSAHAGGIVYGATSYGNAIIKDCTFSGSIKATASAKAENSAGASYVGGIAAIMNNMLSNTASIENCKALSDSTLSASAPTLSSSAVGMSAAYVGGIVGTAVSGNITNCTSNATLNTDAFYKGGILGNGLATLSGNTWPTQYPQVGSEGSNNGSIPTPVPDTGSNTTETTPEKLHVAIVEPIPEEYKTDDLLQKLANNVSTDRSNIQWLPADAINTAELPEPTQSMREQVAKDRYQFMAKLNTIKVSEDSYYAFMVTVSDDLVGTKVSDLKLYYAEPSDFLASTNGSVETAFGLMPLINGVTGGLEVSNFLGVKLDTLPKQFLATMFLSASKSMTVYIVKILLALLGGCNVGLGIVGTLVIGIVAIKFSKKRK